MIDAAIVARRAVRETGLFAPSFAARFDGGAAPVPAELTERVREADRSPSVPISDATWQAWRDQLVRLGAPGPALASWEALAEGRAVAVIAGQQPEFLGGPLYTLYKAATAVAAARRLTQAGRPAVPVFWVASEDSDFEEVRTTRLLLADLQTKEIALPRNAAEAESLVGGVPSATLEGGWATAEGVWLESGGVEPMRRWLDVVRSSARDLGDTQAAWLLRVLGESGLVPFDPRIPGFHLDAEPLYDRYLAHHAAVQRAVDAAGDEIEARGDARPIPDLTSAFALYEIRDGARRKSDPDAARRALQAHAPLTGNVLLRAVTQDALLPVAIHVVGPGEVAYLEQLHGVYERLGVAEPLRVPRLTATWLPKAAWHWVREEGWDPWELAQDPDGMVRGLAQKRLPSELESLVASARTRLGADLGEVARASQELDASLPQLVESVRGKMDFQLGRLLDGMLGKVRTRLDRAHPELPRLRHALKPGDRPQERRIGWLSLVGEAGEETAALVLALAEDHLSTLESGRMEHLLFPTQGEAG